MSTEGTISIYEMLKQRSLDRYGNPKVNWIPAHNRTEVPFTTRTGHRVLYVYDTYSAKHAYLNVETDIIIPDSDLSNYGLS